MLVRSTAPASKAASKAEAVRPLDVLDKLADTVVLPAAPPPPKAVGSALAYIYLLRVPVICAVLFAAFPFLALFTSLRDFAVGIFDIDGREMWAVSTVAFMLSLSIMTTSWLVIAYADDRCGAASIEARFPIRRIWYIASGLLAIPTIGVTYAVGDGDYLLRSIWAVTGLITAAVVFELWKAVIRWMNQFSWVRTLGALLAARPNIGVGYVDLKTREFLPGHRFALGLGLVSALVYFAIGSGHGEVYGVPVPTLVYVLLLILIACWLLSAAAFFLDRYRMPILPRLNLLVTVTGLGWPWVSDHYFQLRPAESLPPTPAQAFRARPAEAPAHSAVVVAANGGGIQAAAWTARTLTGIEELCRARPGCRFAPAVRLISSVSGGTVGTMYVTAAFANGALPDKPVLDKVTKSVEASSLENAGWGALYPDLQRLFFPHFSYDDRGSALERSWLDHFYGNPDELERPLSAWNGDVRAGGRPAVIFNATITDSGERMLMSTAPPRPAIGRETLGRSLYLNQDVNIVTAARLSSTFPWVTPAARPDTDSERELHFVDGGYYDTYGVASMIDWLDEVLKDNQQRPSAERVDRVLIIQLRGAPPDQEKKGKRRGWFYQAYAPLAALLAVRDTGQIARNDEDIELFTRLWRDRVAISTATLQFCTQGDITWRNAPPMSWHMTKDQKDAIDLQWAQEQGSPNMKMILDFLSAPDAAVDKVPAPMPPVGARCAPNPARTPD
jgi:hypothetical protein